MQLTASKRARAAIAAVMALAISVGGVWYSTAPGGGRYPAAVVLSVEAIIRDWEGLRLTAYQDIVGVWTICYGETVGVRPGMTKTKAECEAMLYEHVDRDYYQPLTRCASNFTRAPVPVQAAMISGSYNFGVGAWCGSTAARMLRAGRWPEACAAQTAFNKAGGRVITGLVKRREMGDATRIGEGELCVTEAP